MHEANLLIQIEFYKAALFCLNQLCYMKIKDENQLGFLRMEKDEGF